MQHYCTRIPRAGESSAESSAFYAIETAGLSNLELLSAALMDAQAAIKQGLILGFLDEGALRRAELRARATDVRRLCSPVVLGGVA